ncbi:Putative SOS response-associated peptidase YedK [Roseovarius litorisediminis]|uniref:Abasic site processing protein n=1 Tax=Roseovarius litorisediminis TaxID=1312363 RepID=A0A1Y5TNM2_9RHOB|nr:SOS response-associated peptidase [Roseovarius litorisediminis]SLN68238.1 Putative SOS response-associated peptidase YedK [Roseovarius litorisediminis]
MCGRIANTLPSDAMAQLFSAAPANDLPEVPNFNICPTNDVHVVTAQDGQRRLGAMRWGFLPHWYKSPSDGPLLINARAETIAEKPAFREACRTRRCLIPATGFYEWSKDEDGNRLPWYIHASDGAPIAFAGIWQVWDKGEAPVTSCAIVTTGANAAMSRIHHRMPVIVARDDWPLWLGEAGKGAATLMHAAPEDALEFWRVDPKVNSNRASGPELISPV